jgi:hypothetical protein
MKKISYNPILKGKSTPKLKAEISHISENQIQAPLEYYNFQDFIYEIASMKDYHHVLMIRIR